MSRIASFCLLLTLVAWPARNAQAAPPLPPLKVELTHTGRARIQRISSWAIPSSKVKPLRIPGGGVTSLSILELNNVPLVAVLKGSQAPQRVELTGEEHLPGGYYHIELFLWNNERDWDRHLLRSLGTTFNLDIQKTERQEAIYVLRERRPDDVKPRHVTFSFSFGNVKKKPKRELSWNANPERLAGNLTPLLGRPVINQIASKQRQTLKLEVSDPPNAGELLEQCFEQNLVLEADHRPVTVLTVEPLTND